MTGRLGVIGQIEVQERLARYLQGKRYHPAAILAGENNSTQWQIAKNIAKSLICAAGKLQRTSTAAPTTGGMFCDLFCDQCSACRRIEKEGHPDVLVFDLPDEDTIKIDSVRDLCHQMEVGAIEQTNKICLIRESHRLNAASANAFLKTLEEPGEHRYFWLLTSQVGALLPTVLSRCLRFSSTPELQPVTDIPSPWSPVFENFLRNGEAFRVTAETDSKEKAHDFVIFLQRHLHQQALVSPSRAAAMISIFDETIELEGRLRSNANYALMLESFLTKNFL